MVYLHVIRESIYEGLKEDPKPWDPGPCHHRCHQGLHEVMPLLGGEILLRQNKVKTRKRKREEATIEGEGVKAKNNPGITAEGPTLGKTVGGGKGGGEKAIDLNIRSTASRNQGGMQQSRVGRALSSSQSLHYFLIELNFLNTAKGCRPLPVDNLSLPIARSWLRLRHVHAAKIEFGIFNLRNYLSIYIPYIFGSWPKMSTLAMGIARRGVKGKRWE